MPCCQQALDKDSGGDPTASLDAVVAKLARAKAGRGYSSAREALLLNGRFVLSQVTAHDKRNGGAAADDKGKGKAPAGISSGPFCTELQAEVRELLVARSQLYCESCVLIANCKTQKCLCASLLLLHLAPFM